MREEQQIMLSILKEFDRICRKNNLSYWLCSGTLLGAVRHKGFIPWDDDIDVSMERKDFEIFKKIALKDLRKDMLLDSHSLDEMIKYMPLKIRYKYSEYIEKWDDKENKQKGIYIDVFPFDKFSMNKKIRFLEMFPKFLYKLKTSRIWTKQSGLKYYVKLLIIKILNKLPSFYIIEKNKKYLEKSKKLDKNYVLGFGYGLTWTNTFFKEKIFPLKELNFEGIKLKVPFDSESYLRELYGDYMKIPDESKRQTHAKNIKILKEIEEDGIF